MNRNKLAMVDLDGTLIFTGRANYAAYRQALAEAGFALAEETFQTRCEGRSYRDFLTQYYGNEATAPGFYRKRALAFLQTVPDKPTCSHGDLHIGNIITDGSRDLWIDVGDFAYGVPEWDLSMMYYGAHSLSPERADNIFHLDNDTLRAHWDAFAKVYYGTDSKEAQDAEVRKLQPFIATKIALVISKLSDGKHAFSGPLLQLFDKYLPQ